MGKVVPIVIAGIALVACVILGVKLVGTNKSIKAMETQMTEQQMLLEQTQAQLTDAQTAPPVDTTTVYVLKDDVGSGEECSTDCVEQMDVPTVSAANAITDLTDCQGKFFRLDLNKGTILDKNMLFDFVITEDMRYLDVVVDQLPIGIKEGDYVDLRIFFPNGKDLVGMSHKMIRQINGNTVKLIVTLKDLYTDLSMKLDKATFNNTKVYCIEYIDAGTQTDTDNFYPLSNSVLAAMQNDVNITVDYADAQYTKKIRKSLEKSLATAIKAGTISKNDSVSPGLANIDAQLSSAAAAYTAQEAAREQAAQEEAQRQAELEAEEAERQAEIAAEEAAMAAEEAAAEAATQQQGK